MNEGGWEGCLSLRVATYRRSPYETAPNSDGSAEPLEHFLPLLVFLAEIREHFPHLEVGNHRLRNERVVNHPELLVHALDSVKDPVRSQLIIVPLVVAPVVVAFRGSQRVALGMENG